MIRTLRSTAGRGALVLMMGGALLSTGCRKNGGNATGPKPGPATAYTQIDYATSGTITGTIRFPKTPPSRVRIDMAQDPVCGLAADNLSEQYMVKDGGLQNVFVYVKDGLNGKVYLPPTTAVTLDQKGCRYTPHVIAVMVGQPVDFTNSDATMHNVHVMPMVNGDQNMDVSQPPRGGETKRVFLKPETMMPVRCNNHPWMQAFINVAPNPFFAVTDESGHFEIKGLPPGTYTLVAVHEELGQQTAQVTVTSKATTPTQMSFIGSAQ
ncbi:MAG TPA: carboxypeptidase regulatory-like domain-containing protein [Acidisarcina sp.]|nr:carboxypeptidase regulatory-like domain-containing protein [Acidisarcina sp.]